MDLLGRLQASLQATKLSLWVSLMIHGYKVPLAGCKNRANARLNT